QRAGKMRRHRNSLSYSPETVEWKHGTDARLLSFSMFDLNLAQIVVIQEEAAVNWIGKMEDIPGTSCYRGRERRITFQQERHFTFHAAAKSASSTAKSIALSANVVEDTVRKSKEQGNRAFAVRRTHSPYH